jgi:uncharacterized protein YneF (UPF0154 family)
MNDMRRAGWTFGCIWVVTLVVNLALMGLVVYGIWIGIQALQKYIAS